jgi:VCBS repeat-containing protein
LVVPPGAALAQIGQPPTVTLTGANPQLILQGGAYTELGATANDPEDGNLTGDIVITGVGTINTNVPGNYTVTYTVTDSDGNSDAQNRTVTVNGNPVAVADSYITNEDATLTVNAATGVLANDTDPEMGALTAVLDSNVANGALTLNANGSFTYTPSANFSGIDGFTYHADDGPLNSSTVAVTITANSVNDAPVAVNDSYSTADNTALAISAANGVLANDIDADPGTTLTAVLDVNVTNGTLTLNPNGSFSYTPNLNFSGGDSFTYHANDGTLGSNIVTVSITVTFANDAPVAVDDIYSTAEDTPLSVNPANSVVANDIDDGNNLNIVLVTNVTNGTLVLNANDSFTYTPNSNFNGTDSFTYRASDGQLQSNNVATATITVTAAGDPPNAVDDSFTVSEDSAANAFNVLANDTDPDTADTKTITAVGTPNQGGTVTIVGGITPNNTLSYTPAAGFFGTETFTYTMRDTLLATDTATVTVTVSNVNDAPTFTNAGPTVATEDSPYSYTMTASDTDGDTPIFAAPTLPAWLTFNGTNTISGTPQQANVGSHNVTVTVSDGIAAAVPQNFQITVGNVNDAPTAVNDAYNTPEDTPLDVVAPGVLGNDTDPDIDTTLTAVLGATNVTNGTLTLNADGSFSYTPNADFNGVDTFTYFASDGTAQSATEATVTITVDAGNDGPIANDDAYSTNEDAVLTIAAPGVLTNDADAEANPLTAVLVAPPLNGLLTFNPDGSFEYTPNLDYSGGDSFTYQASDGTATDGSELSNVATVVITINAVNDIPIASDDAYGTAEDTTLTINDPLTEGVLANDTDADGTGPTTGLTAVLVDSPLHGTLTLSADGTFTYLPDADYVGPDTFRYEANDGTGSSNIATVAIDVTTVNDPPAQEGPIAAPNATESVPYTFDLGPFFTDNDGDALYFAANTGAHPTGLPLSGNLEIDPDGSLTGFAGRIFGTAANEDTSDLGPRTITVTVSDLPFDDPAFDPTLNTAQAEVLLTIAALGRVDLALTAAAAPNPAGVNAPVTWDITITNGSPLVAVDEGQVVLDATFSGVPFTFTATTGCTVTGQSLSCTVGAIPPSGSVVQTISGQATQAGDTVLLATAAIPVVTGFEPVDPNVANNSVVLTLNVGQSFSAGPAQTVSTASRGTGAGDINGDGYIDLVVATGAGSSTEVYLSEPKDPLDPNGAPYRRLATTPILLGDSGVNSQDAVLVDLDNDADLDLVVANGALNSPQPNSVYINDLVQGQANLTLSPAGLGNGVTWALAAADLDLNGFNDIVAANGSPNEIYFNQGGGNFDAPVLLGNSDSRGVAIADFDGDGRPDLVFANSDGPSELYRNLGGGAFDAAILIEAEPTVTVRAGDISGDGRPDLVFGRETATPPALPEKILHVNTSSPGVITFVRSLGALGTSPTLEVVAIDVSLDGRLDIVSLNGTGTHQIYVGAGNSTFTLHAQQFSSAAPTGSSVGDFNNDGRPDLAVSGPAGVDVFLNDGRGNLGPGDLDAPTIQLVGSPAVTLTVQDVYTDPGATAMDATDGNVTARIIVTNSVDTAVIGTYTVTYNATDLSGNKAVPVTRTVSVQARQGTGGGGGGAAEPLLIVLLVLSGILGRLTRGRLPVRERE